MNAYISTDNPEMCRLIGNSTDFKAVELFKAERRDHKYSPGDSCMLTGLKAFPEYNGEIVEISSIREDGAFGKAYYVKGRINEVLNWIYEYRLIQNL